MDRTKIEAMKNWPTTATVKELRGFLGLTGYYRSFLKGYGGISKPLTELVKKNRFGWNEEAVRAFENLKEVTTIAPVLAMPDYSKPFTLEVDACRNGMCSTHSKGEAICPKNMVLSTYEKDFLAILLSVSKWKHYLSS